MNITFTGTRKPPEHTANLIRWVLLGLPATSGLIVGGAVGVDELVALEAIGMGRGKYVHAVLPCTTDPADLPWLRSVDSVTQMERGTSFKQRDTRMVEMGDRTIAFPLHPETDATMLRSGTWMTVRIARRAGKFNEQDLYILSQQELYPT